MAKNNPESVTCLSCGKVIATFPEGAHFLLHVHKLAEDCWQWDYYNFVGPLLKSEQYADKDGHNRNGVTRFYNGEGLLDSSATFKDGKMDGDAYKLTTDSFRIKMKYVYRDDTLVSVIDPAVDKKDSVQSIEKESEFPAGRGIASDCHRLRQMAARRQRRQGGEDL